MSDLALDRVGFSYGAGKPILHDVSLSMGSGGNLGIVGESGSGKTTMLRLLLGLTRPTTGAVLLDGQSVDPGNSSFMREYRRAVQPVFQDPYSSLDPRQKVFDIIAEPLRSLRIDGDTAQSVAAALEAVSLPSDAARRYPHEFSGGQRQRIAIARAIVAKPRFILADEAVSALDLSTRIRIVELFRRLSADTTLVFVSHDLGVVAALCERILILEKGRVVETGETRQVLTAPQHPYTRKLLASVPRMPA